MPKQIVIAIAVLLAWGLPARALDSEGNYFIRGVGNELCASYNIARDGHTDAEYAAWLAGYISAFNRWTSDVWDIEGSGGFDSALRWLDYYCHSHPSQTFASATENLAAFLYPNRQRSPRTAAQGSGNAGSSLPPR